MADPYRIGVDLRAGLLLAATPKLESSVWKRSVVVITEHTPNSTVGIVVNRASDYSLETVLQEYYSQELDSYELHWGGPVNPRAMVLLHEDTWYSSNTAWITDGLAQSSDMFMFDKIATGNVPIDMRLCQGLSVWAPGQLQYEIDQGLWLTANADPSIIFKHDSDTLWKKTVEIAAAERIKEMF